MPRLLTSLIAAAALFTAADRLAAEVWVPLPAMPGAKHHAFAVQVGATFLAIGGPPWANGGDADGSAYTFNGTTWSAAAPIDGEGPVLGLGGAIDGLGRIILFGGVNSDNGDDGKGKVYDPAQGTMASLPDRHDNAPREHFAVARDESGRVYSIGGGAGASGANTGFTERYVASTKSWQAVASVPVGIADAAACSDGAGHILVFGGFNASGTSRSADVWRLDVATNTWNNSAVPDLPVALTHAVAVRGNDQRIYVIGGESGGVPSGTVLSSVLVFNLIDNTWASGPTMSVARRDHAAALASGDFIVVAGGTTLGGAALASAEKLYAPTCPSFLTQSPNAQPWQGQTIAISASVGGGGTMTFAWARDGVPLDDGPSGSGSTLSGATTPTLTITGFGASDVGEYTLTATNACGTSTSPAIALDVRTPPAIPAHWTVTNLHPAWAESSGANCVQNGKQGGSGVMDVAGYNNLQQPILWEGTAASAVNVTPSNSVGGAIFDMDGDMLVGSWWWPYPCYVSGQWYTCYYWQACRWTGVEGGPLEHDPLQVSGWDIGSATCVKEGMIGGSQLLEEGQPGGSGIVWTAPNYVAGWPMNPIGTSASWVSAVDAGDAFGGIQTPLPGPTNHAAKFPGGAAANWIGLHPAGYPASGISDADEGQQVGTTGWFNDAKAALWYGVAASHQSLHPAGATRSGLYACMGGVQGGQVTVLGQDRATLWTGSAASAFDLHQFLPAEFTASSLADIEVHEDGSMVAVGAAYNATAGRWEAVMWSSGANEVLGDLNGDGHVDGADLATMLGAWGTAGAAADLNSDGVVDGADLAILLGAWL